MWTETGSYYIELTLDTDKNTGVKKIFRYAPGGYDKKVKYNIAGAATTLNAGDFIARDGVKADGGAAVTTAPATPATPDPAPSAPAKVTVKADPTITSGKQVTLATGQSTASLNGKKVYVIVYRASGDTSTPVAWGVAVGGNTTVMGPYYGVKVYLQKWNDTAEFTDIGGTYQIWTLVGDPTKGYNNGYEIKKSGSPVTWAILTGSSSNQNYLAFTTQSTNPPGMPGF